MDFPLKKLPMPKYKDKPSKIKKVKPPVMVKKIDELFSEKFLKKYFD